MLIVENGHENKDNEHRNVLENEDKSIQFDEKSYTTPYETDKTDFLTADNTLLAMKILLMEEDLN